MVQVLSMPMMGNTMEVGVVVEWTVSEGETVAEGETVVVVESEKATQEIVSTQRGSLEDIEVDEGEEVPPGTRLGVIRGPEEEDSPTSSESNELSDTAAGRDTGDEPIDETTAGDASEAETAGKRRRIPAAPGARKRAREKSLPLEEIDGSGPDGAVLLADIDRHVREDEQPTEATSTAQGYIPASPQVRKLARELEVNLGQLSEAIDNRRITISDVRRAAGLDTQFPGPADRADQGMVSGQSDESGKQIDPADYGYTIAEKRRLSGMRQTIARRMSQSVRQKPHVTINRHVNVERALSVVEEYKGSAINIGLTDILVYAAVDALETHPAFNAWYTDETHVLIEEVNIGIAVDISDGLVTPVLRDAGQKSPRDLAAERSSLVTAVQQGQYDPEDIQGGTFTISNLGMLGVDSFDPIINPPEIAILGVGRVQEGKDNRKFTLSLSFDHRIVDGADAARFLGTIADGITSPTTLIEQRTYIALDKQQATTSL